VFQPATSDSALKPDRSSPSFSEQVERQDQEDLLLLLRSPSETWRSQETVGRRERRRGIQVALGLARSEKDSEGWESWRRRGTSVVAVVAAAAAAVAEKGMN